MDTPGDQPEQLKSSEALLTAALRDSNDVVVVHDFDYHILAWNQAAETILGVPAVEALERDFDKFIPDNLREDASAIIDRLRSREIIEPYETCLIAGDGRLIDVWVVASTLLNEAGTAYAIVTTARDITAVKLAEQESRDIQAGRVRQVKDRADELELLSDTFRGEKELLRVTLASIGDAVITTDADGYITYLNPMAVQLTGWDNASVRGIALTEVFRILSKTNHEPVENPVQKCLRDGQVRGLANDTLLIRRDGQSFNIDDSAAPIFDNKGKVLGAVLIFRDISEKRRMADQLILQAMHDALTGLVNRREFIYRIKRVLADQRPHDHNALLYMDLDQFKIINDSCGHIAGDELLRQISSLMLSEVRSRDTLARIGGDEFGLLLEHCSLERAIVIGNNLRQKILDYRFGWKDKVFTLGVSIGAVSIDPGDSLINVLSNADAACYAAKEHGRNRVHVYQSDDESLRLRQGEMQWTSRIKSALAKGRFQLYCQPIKALKSVEQNNKHCEILLRLAEEKGKIILPGEFIPAAERYELMGSIDRWVIGACLNKLCNQKPVPYGIFSINVSGQSIGDKEFLEFVVDLLRKYDTLPAHLCFEITETAAITNLVNARQYITTLKEMGCRFALDDFGSGLSSFGYLQSLPVDYLKIDGRFVKDMVNNPIDRVMVESICRIGHQMGHAMIAEWVESDITTNMLRDIGVDYAQGYAIGHPAAL